MNFDFHDPNFWFLIVFAVLGIGLLIFHEIWTDQILYKIYIKNLKEKEDNEMKKSTKNPED